MSQEIKTPWDGKLSAIAWERKKAYRLGYLSRDQEVERLREALSETLIALKALPSVQLWAVDGGPAVVLAEAALKGEQ